MKSVIELREDIATVVGAAGRTVEQRWRQDGIELSPERLSELRHVWTLPTTLRQLLLMLGLFRCPVSPVDYSLLPTRATQVTVTSYSTLRNESSVSFRRVWSTPQRQWHIFVKEVFAGTAALSAAMNLQSCTPSTHLTLFTDSTAARACIERGLTQNLIANAFIARLRTDLWRRLCVI